jgi:small nuclear ribonucleoprotein (snRNP)-like protein
MHRSWRDLLAETVVVNLKSGKAFQGVLWSQRKDLLVLRDAVLFEHGEQTPVDGEVLVERSNVDFVQIPRTVH